MNTDAPNMWHEAVERALKRQGTVKAEAAKWIAEILQEDARQQSGRGGVKIRKAGEQVSHEALKELGLRSNVRLGEAFLSSLTEKGRRDPIYAAECLWRETMTIIYSSRDLAEAIHLNCLVKLLLTKGVPRDELCTAARRLRSVRFKALEAPEIPLTDCDAQVCDCAWITVVD